jgi:hypothetical protein
MEEWRQSSSILDRGNRWSGVVISGCLIPWERILSMHWLVGCVSIRAYGEYNNLDIVGKRTRSFRTFIVLYRPILIFRFTFSGRSWESEWLQAFGEFRIFIIFS